MTAIAVNPLALFIAFLEADAAVVAATEGRIAPRHQYTQGWAHGSPALVVQPTGGPGEPYVADQTPLIRCEAFAENYTDAYGIYLAVAGAVRGSKRQPIVLSGGYTGLLRDLSLETQPTLTFDRDVNMPVLYFFVRAMVAEAAVVTP